MEIINKSFTPSPIWVHKPKPENMTPKETERYFKDEYVKWVEGVEYLGNGIGIPGSLYHFIQEQWIKHRVVDIGENAIQRPICRDVDFMLHHKANDCMKKGKILLVLKGTGVGLSTFGASLAPYTAITRPGSNSLITSHNTKALSMIFQDKILEPMNQYDEGILPREPKHPEKVLFHRLNASAQNSLLKVNVRSLQNGQEAISSIDCRETTEKPSSPNNFGGVGANLAYVDEFCVHKRKMDVLKALVSRMRDRNTRLMKGFILLGGACEMGEKTKDNKISSSDIQEIKNLITPESLEAWDMEMMFLPFWMGTYMTNGHSNEKLAMEWWEKQAEKKIKDPDPSVFRNFKMENPRFLEDIFDNVSSNRWDSAVAEKIKVQYEEVKKADVPIQVCSVINMNGSFEFGTGKNTFILEHPKQGVDYHITVDGVQSSALTSEQNNDNSKLALCVTKMIDGLTLPYMPVLLHAELPKDGLEASIYKLIDIIKLYNKYGGVKGVNSERNVGFGEFFGSILVKESLGHLIMKKKDFSANGFKETTKWFYYRDDETLARQYNLANSFLRKNISSIQMLPLLNDMMQPVGINTDLLDAWLGLFESVPDIGSEKKKVAASLRTRETTYLTWEDGRMVCKTKVIGGNPQQIFIPN